MSLLISVNAIMNDILVSMNHQLINKSLIHINKFIFVDIYE